MTGTKGPPWTHRKGGHCRKYRDQPRKRSVSSRTACLRHRRRRRVEGIYGRISKGMDRGVVYGVWCGVCGMVCVVWSLACVGSRILKNDPVSLTYSLNSSPVPLARIPLSSFPFLPFPLLLSYLRLDAFAFSAASTRNSDQGRSFVNGVLSSRGRGRGAPRAPFRCGCRSFTMLC